MRRDWGQRLHLGGAGLMGVASESLASVGLMGTSCMWIGLAEISADP